jgi:tRNA(adenine34) deaminase
MRTPDICFANLPGYPWAPHYINDLPSLAGLRMHYVDEGARDAAATFVCLHGCPTWSYTYRKMIEVLVQAGHRVIAPDMIGFGKSDKPKKESAHSFSWHRQVLIELIERLKLQNIVLVLQDWGGILGLTLPMQAPQRYRGLWVMNTLLPTGDEPLPYGFLNWREWCAKNPEYDVAMLLSRGNSHLSREECAAYAAPFPDSGHRAALRAFPALVPETMNADGALLARQAREFLQQRWSGASFMAIGLQDPVLGTTVMRELQKRINLCPAPMLLEDAGHFVQERGEGIAQAALAHFSSELRRV